MMSWKRGRTENASEEDDENCDVLHVDESEYIDEEALLQLGSDDEPDTCANDDLLEGDGDMFCGSLGSPPQGKADCDKQTTTDHQQERAEANASTRCGGHGGTTSASHLNDGTTDTAPCKPEQLPVLTSQALVSDVGLSNLVVNSKDELDTPKEMSADARSNTVTEEKNNPVASTSRNSSSPGKSAVREQQDHLKRRHFASPPYSRHAAGKFSNGVSPTSAGKHAMRGRNSSRNNIHVNPHFRGHVLPQRMHKFRGPDLSHPGRDFQHWQQPMPIGPMMVPVPVRSQGLLNVQQHQNDLQCLINIIAAAADQTNCFGNRTQIQLPASPRPSFSSPLLRLAQAACLQKTSPAQATQAGLQQNIQLQDGAVHHLVQSSAASATDTIRVDYRVDQEESYASHRLHTAAMVGSSFEAYGNADTNIEHQEISARGCGVSSRTPNRYSQEEPNGLQKLVGSCRQNSFSTGDLTADENKKPVPAPISRNKTQPENEDYHNTDAKVQIEYNHGTGDCDYRIPHSNKDSVPDTKATGVPINASSTHVLNVSKEVVFKSANEAGVGGDQSQLVSTRMSNSNDIRRVALSGQCLPGGSHSRGNNQAAACHRPSVDRKEFGQAASQCRPNMPALKSVYGRRAAPAGDGSPAGRLPGGSAQIAQGRGFKDQVKDRTVPKSSSLPAEGLQHKTVSSSANGELKNNWMSDVIDPHYLEQMKIQEQRREEIMRRKEAQRLREAERKRTEISKQSNTQQSNTQQSNTQQSNIQQSSTQQSMSDPKRILLPTPGSRRGNPPLRKHGESPAEAPSCDDQKKSDVSATHIRACAESLHGEEPLIKRPHVAVPTAVAEKHQLPADQSRPKKLSEKQRLLHRRMLMLQKQSGIKHKSDGAKPSIAELDGGGFSSRLGLPSGNGAKELQANREQNLRGRTGYPASMHASAVPKGMTVVSNVRSQNESTSVQICNISASTTIESLCMLAVSCGHILDAAFVDGRIGQARITFTSFSGAEAFCKKFNNAVVDRARITVDLIRW